MLTVLVLAAWPVRGQGAPDGLQFTTIDPPGSEAAARALDASGVAHAAVYATRIEGGRLTPVSRPPRLPRSVPMQGPLLDGNLALVVVVGLLIAGVFLWLRFAGAGILGSGPKDAPARPVSPPAGWKQEDAPDLGTEALLAAIAAMPDRRAAMVRLLRHCLLHAATVSGTRLARSDTERMVLRRLPDNWRRTGPLPELLHRTELAHYGGQDVPDAGFADCLGAARSILGRTGGAHA